MKRKSKLEEQKQDSQAQIIEEVFLMMVSFVSVFMNYCRSYLDSRDCIFYFLIATLGQWKGPEM